MRLTYTISTPEDVLQEMKELAKTHRRSVSGEFVFAAERWIRHCEEMNDRSFSYEIDLAAARLIRNYEEMNDERNEPLDDNPRAFPRA